MKVHEIGFFGHFLELFERLQGEPGGSNIEVLLDPGHLVIRYLQPCRGRIGAQCQHFALDAECPSALTKLEDNLLDAAGCVGIISLKEMQNAHSAPDWLPEGPAYLLLITETILKKLSLNL